MKTIKLNKKLSIGLVSSALALIVCCGAARAQIACPMGSAATTLYFNNFEIDGGGFTEAGFGEWERGAPVTGVYENCDSSPQPEPPGAFSGANVWATNLNGCYQNSNSESTLSRTFDFTNVQAPITLSWQDWHHIFRTFDAGELIVNGTVLYAVPDSTASGAYAPVSVDLSAYAGQANVQVTYRFFATTVVNRSGWYIDDVRVQTCAVLTAANVTLGGRVLTANGRGIRNVYVTMFDGSGGNRTAVSSAFGYYRFEDVPAGATYVLSVAAKRYSFSQSVQTLNISGAMGDIDFIADN